jgi:chemotaxis protein CheX
MTAERVANPEPRGAAVRRVGLVNRYVAAAVEILGHEIRETVERGPVVAEANPYTTDDVTAVVGISGDVSGSFYLSMSEATALGIVGAMLGQPVEEFDEIARSGIAELANVVAGAAGIALAADGLSTNISPPLLLHGAGARLSTVDLQRLVVSLRTRLGPVAVHVAVRDRSAS